MTEEKVKLIPFTKELEDKIEADAKRCQRSFVRQVVAVLAAYYETGDVEINREKLIILGELAGKSGKKTKIIEAETGKKKKKKTG